MSIPEVGLLVETDSSWGRNVVRGVASYAEKFGPWNLLLEPTEPLRSHTVPEAWRVDGIIARVNSPLLLKQVLALGAPVVDVDDSFIDEPRIDSVVTNPDERAELAFSHFRTKGFESIAYYAPPSRNYSRRRGRAFAEVVRSHGMTCHHYRPGYRAGRQISQEEHRSRVSRWLSQLPLPVAILAVNAKRGKELVEICTLAGYQVPDQVAVLASDTDELSCEVCSPPLSSISVGSARIGHEAAAQLDRRMRGAEPNAEPIFVSPNGVLSRQSTDILAIDDPMIVRALRFMQAHACRGIVIEDVLAEVPISRRQLERLFKQNIGRLPAEELRRIRLERGRQLLSETEVPVDEVAEACGYAGSTQFGAAFRKRYGMTPLAFRKSIPAS